MACVYLAMEAPPTARPVALKAIAPTLAHDPAYRDRLRREATAAAALTDSGICTIYAFEEIEGDLYIASEYLDGRTLRAEIETGSRPSANDVLRAARELAQALSVAHRQGIVHRDLKPENIMRTGPGRLKILDFGLALIEPPGRDPEPSATHHTLPGTLVGTPAYMPPEVLNGQRADSRADVWALGVLLHEFATGSHPFAAEHRFGAMARILEREPASLGRSRPDLPAQFVAIIERCLRKNPDDRFGSASEIVVALEQLVALPPATAPLARWWRMHQLVVIALYFVACLLAWQVKEWRPGVTTGIFVAICAAATIGGIFRGYLLFVERVNGSGLETERHRARPVTLAFDLSVAMALVVDGGLLAPARPVPAVITIGLGLGIALTRLVIEPGTTAATFPGIAPR
jgi:hypothetical protein